MNEVKEVCPVRAATIKERPSFSLMTQNDIQSRYYMQMPLWLFLMPGMPT